MKTICIFGDSVTWGRGLSTRVSWANLLRNYLEDQDPSMHLYDLGVDGDTTHEILKRFAVEAAARKPDLVLWAVGLNDSAYRKTLEHKLVSESEFEVNMQTLIDACKKVCTNQVVIGIAKGSDKVTMPLPDSTTGKCYTKNRVLQYDDILRSVAETHGIKYIRISGSLTDGDFYDGLHPNVRGHMKIFLTVQPEIS